MSTGINVTKPIKILDEGVLLTSDVSQIDFTGGVTATTSGNNVTVNVPAAGITVGTTPVTSGTDGRVFFQAGGVVQQDAAFFWDNTNKRLGVGATPSTSVRLDVRAQGALSTDIAFRVRNSADTANIISVTGNNFVGINTDTQSISGSSTTVGLRVNNGATNLLTLWDSGGLSLGAGASSSGSAGAGNHVTGVAIGANSSSFINSVTVGPGSYSASISTIAIGQSVASGGSSGTRIVAIGSTVNADTSGGGGSDNVLIGNNLLLGRDNSGNVIIGTHLGNRGSAAGSLGVSRNIYIGGFLDQNVNSRQNIIALGFGVSSASKITPDINDSFQLYFSNNERSFFVNKNTNMVLKSLGALVSGTDFEAAATNTITIHNGTAPTTNIATAGQLYSESGALRYRDSAGTITNVGGSVQAVVSAATVTPVYTNKFVKITAQAAALTLANPTGTWAEGQDLMIRIKDDGTARAITWDTNYRAIGVTLPTTTVINKTTYVGIIYNSTDGKWDAIGVTTEA